MALDPQTERQAQPHQQPHYLWWATAAALGISGATAALVTGVAGLLVYQFARAAKQWGTDEPPEGTSEAVSFTSAGDNMHISGWFFDAAGDASPAPAVVLCHGIRTGRRECLPMALRFRAAGYSVLVFDFRAHGESEGQFISVGFHETNDVLGAIEYLKSRPSVDATRIGVVGFSMGGVAAIQAAAQSTDIAVVVADSAYASFLDAARYSFHVVAGLPHFPLAPMAMRLAQWMVHVDPTQLRPVDVIGRIAPRPILLTHGTLDEIVPLRHARILFAAAEEPKELWVVDGAHHVGARDNDPDAYFERVERFVRQVLTPDLSASAASPSP